MPDLICVAKDGLRFGKINLAYGETFHTNRWKANQVKAMFPEGVVVVGNATDEKVVEVLARFEEAEKPKRGRPKEMDKTIAEAEDETESKTAKSS